MIEIFMLLVGASALAGGILLDKDSSEVDDSDMVNDEVLDSDGSTDLIENSSPVSDPISSDGNIIEDGDPTEDDDYLMDVTGPDIELENEDFADQSALIEISIDMLNDMPSPLADWVFESNVRVIEAEEDDVVQVETSDDVSGSLYVLNANHFENGSGNGSGPIHEHTGQNIYFVPDGTDFPDDYEWSSEGATLFNTSSGSDDEAAFNNIKFIARIDTGSWGGEIDENGEFSILFDDRVGVPTLKSDLEIIYR